MNIKHGLNKLREAFFYIEARLNNMGLTISYGWLYVVNNIYYVSERKKQQYWHSEYIISYVCIDYLWPVFFSITHQTWW